MAQILLEALSYSWLVEERKRRTHDSFENHSAAEHIRVMLLLERFHGRLRRPLEIWSHLAGTFFCGALALYSVRLVWLSWKLNDISQGNDATPLWIPQIGMAAGALVLLVAMVDDLVRVVRGRELAAAPDELKAIE